jgi:thiamine-monophosphate kinase
MKVSELGEFGLIDLLAKKIAESPHMQPPPEGMIIGIGDDTAAWRSSDSVQLATVDTMVQDVHFSLETASWREIGWKSLAINLSDIAAMGGVARYALVAMALPEDTDIEDVSALYEGMIELAGKSQVAIAGGNISRSPMVSVTITVIGGSDTDVLRRSTASIGDAIAVTGYTGSAAAGLAMLQNKLDFSPEVTGYLRDAFLRPVPRLIEGQALLKHGIKTAIDTSDGLISDLHHICEASNVGARLNIDRLPIHDAVKNNFKDEALELALSGGEDYELLFTGSTKALKELKAEIDCPVTLIGEITAGESGKIDLMDAAGKRINISKTGWTHF